MDWSRPGSLVHRISQARILEWVAICFSGGSSWPRDQTHISCMTSRFFTTRDSRRPIPWLRNSNGHHQPHQALPRDWVISVFRGRVFSLIGSFRSSVTLWYEWAILDHLLNLDWGMQWGSCEKSVPSIAGLSLFCKQVLVHTCSSGEQSPGFPLSFSLSKQFSNQPRGLSPSWRTLGLGYPICGLTLGLLSLCLFTTLSLISSESLFWGHRSQLHCFSSLPTWLNLYLSYHPLDVQFFLPVSSLFSARIVPHVDIFLIYSRGKVNSTLSYLTGQKCLTWWILPTREARKSCFYSCW